MKLEKSQESPQQKLREKFLDAALELVKHYYHEDSRCHIHYCEPLSYLGFRGVGSQPNESFYNYQEKVRESAQKVPERILIQWISVLDEQIKAKEPTYSAHYSNDGLFISHNPKKPPSWQFDFASLGVRTQSLNSSKAMRVIEAAAKEMFEHLYFVGNPVAPLSHLADFSALVYIKPRPENDIPMKRSNAVTLSLTEENKAKISIIDDRERLSDIVNLLAAENSNNRYRKYRFTRTSMLNSTKNIGHKQNK
jgi:hypothetical protein